MARKRRPRSRRPHSASRAPAERGRWGRWLGWGAAGLAGLALLGRPRRRASSVRRVAEPAPAPPAPPLELPSGVALSWLAGPSGSLRVAEVHPGGRRSVVFVHGLAGGLEHWAAQLAALGPALHGVAFDLPGHGGSDRDPAGEYSIASLGASLAAVIDGLGLRRPLLVAHAVGALVVLDYAVRRPGRVAGILLVDASGDQTALAEADRERFLDALRRDPRGELEWGFRQLLSEARPEVAERVLQGVRELPEEAIAGILESAASYPPLAALERYRGPARSVVSDRNDLPSSLHRLRPAMPCRFLAGASHWLMMDRPEEIWEELVELLEDVRS